MSTSSDDEEPSIGIESLRPEALAALRLVQSTTQDEDYSLSQFWYTSCCADDFAAAVSKHTSHPAILSCPTFHDGLVRCRIDSTNFEYDEKFTDERFVKFDYRCPIDQARRDAYDLVVLDPPYVSREVVEEYLKHAEFLNSAKKIIFITSVVNREWLRDEHGLYLTNFKLRFVSKMATPLRVFCFQDSSLIANLGGIDAYE